MSVPMCQLLSVECCSRKLKIRLAGLNLAHAVPGRETFYWSVRISLWGHRLYDCRKCGSKLWKWGDFPGGPCLRICHPWDTGFGFWVGN